MRAITRRFLGALILSLTSGVSQADVRIGLDSNGDGLIRTAQQYPPAPIDQVGSAAPFVFWVNDDQDDLQEYESWPVRRPDSATAVIDSKRDLEDFARIHIDLDRPFLELTLKWATSDLPQPPSLNVFLAVDCSTAYLRDDTVAQAQLARPYLQQLGTLTAAQPLQLSALHGSVGAGSLGTGNSVCLLFDAASAGKGALVATAETADGILVSAPAFIDIRPVKTMYRRVRVPWPEGLAAPWEYRDRQPPAPQLNWSWDLADGIYEPPPGLDTEAPGNRLVWIYGWQRDGQANYQMATTLVGETVFKRLWHRGYRDEIVFFHWSTVKPRLAYGLLQSEYRALKTGRVLAEFVDSLPSDKRLHLTAHSLGNVVLLEALKNGMNAEQAIFQQAALPAGAIDARAVLQRSEVRPNPVRLSYSGYLDATDTPLFNLYNKFDHTFVGWNLAQRVFKPLSIGGQNYRYVANAPVAERYQLHVRNLSGRSVRIVKDPHEILAFIEGARTQALGAEPRTRGFVQGSIDLGEPPYSFGPGHVVAWKWNLQKTTSYYNRLLDTMNIPYLSRQL